MKITKLQMPDGTLVKIEGGGDRDVDEYISNHYRKQHEAAQLQYQSEIAQQQPMVRNYCGEQEVLPLPVMNFGPPAGAQAISASALVANEQEVLPLPVLTF